MRELKIAKLSFPSRRQPAVNHACLWERLGQKDGFDIFADPPGSALLVGVVCLRARQQGGQEGDELRENAGADRSDAPHREPGEQAAPEPLPHPTPPHWVVAGGGGGGQAEPTQASGGGAEPRHGWGEALGQ